jgi:hypothetical protein
MPRIHIFRSTLSGAVLALAAFLSLPGAASAQEVGLFLSQGATGLDELARPSGFALSYRVAPTPRLSLRATLFRKSDAFDRTSRVCIQYEPAVGCNNEFVQTETRLHGVVLAAHLRQRLHDLVEIEGGGGVSMSRVGASEVTESGRTSDLFTQNTGQPGVVLGGAFRVRPARRIPVTLEVGVAQQFIRMNACSDDPWRYDPYCGVTGFREIRVGLGVGRGW